MLEVNSEALSRLTLRIKTDDDAEPREYTLAFPISAVMAAEKATGKDLKSLNGWLSLETKDFATVIEAGLAKFHPNIDAGELSAIIESLTLEALDEVHFALCKLTFPRLMAEIESRKGSQSPNLESADVR